MSEKNPDSKKSILLLGSSSSLAEQILIRALLEGYQVDGVRRSQKRSEKDNQFNKCFDLDLDLGSSVEKFTKTIAGYQYERIICLLGKLYKSFAHDTHLNSIQKYFASYGANLLYLVKRLCENNLDTSGKSQLTLISSRAQKHPSNDIYYSAVKGAAVSFIRSLAPMLPSNKAVISISPGLIQGSAMASVMSDENVENHAFRSNYRLLTLDSAAEEIWKLSLLDNIQRGLGTDFVIGPDYE